MEKVSYKNKFLIALVLMSALIFVALYNLLDGYSNTNLDQISKKNFKIKTLEKEEQIYNLLEPYKNTIKAISKDKLFQNYIETKTNKENVENLFLTINKSLSLITQIRFIDMKGLEQINIQHKKISSELEDKSSREYFKKFVVLEKNEIGLSKINLNKENGKVTLPKELIIRMALIVEDSSRVKKGMIVINIILNEFFELLNKSTLYNIHLIDGKGDFIFHHDKNFGLLGDKSDFTIFDEFKGLSKAILNNDEYYTENFYSKKLKYLDNNQDIRFIIESKFRHEIEDRKINESNFILYILVFFIMGIILSYYFSLLPDKLNEKIKKDRLTDKTTSLPNKIALMEELENGEFTNSIIILVSLNNLIRIQNSYGQKISNLLLNEVIEFLDTYDEYSIRKLYLNRYNVISIKYTYSDDITLKNFLEKLVFDIDKHVFEIKEVALEFSLEVTLGISNPHHLNNSLDELNEAENALEYAQSHRHQMDIFDINNEKNIILNKENILMSRKIKYAIETNNIFMEYQPIYNNRRQKIEKYESLVRMVIDDKTIYPDSFLPVAKEINKYHEFSKKVLETTFEFFKDKDYEFSINLSVLDIMNSDFKKMLFSHLEEYNYGSKVVLEIVEQEGIDNYDEFFDFIKEVKKYDCKIAIDDFGSGYSNFEYLIRMSEYIDYLKIDGSLIKNIQNDNKAQLLVGTLKFLCDSLNILTIAEYIEDKDVYDYVVSMGINYSQGYYIGRSNKELQEDNKLKG